jgi:hypothetical protein
MRCSGSESVDSAVRGPIEGNEVEVTNEIVDDLWSICDEFQFWSLLERVNAFKKTPTYQIKKLNERINALEKSQKASLNDALGRLSQTEAGVRELQSWRRNLSEGSRAANDFIPGGRHRAASESRQSQRTSSHANEASKPSRKPVYSHAKDADTHVSTGKQTVAQDIPGPGSPRPPKTAAGIRPPGGGEASQSTRDSSAARPNVSGFDNETQLQGNKVPVKQSDPRTEAARFEDVGGIEIQGAQRKGPDQKNDQPAASAPKQLRAGTAMSAEKGKDDTAVGARVTPKPAEPVSANIVDVPKKQAPVGTGAKDPKSSVQQRSEDAKKAPVSTPTGSTTKPSRFSSGLGNDDDSDLDDDSDIANLLKKPGAKDSKSSVQQRSEDAKKAPVSTPTGSTTKPSRFSSGQQRSEDAKEGSSASPRTGWDSK